MKKLKEIFQIVKDNLSYVVLIVLSIFVMEIFIDTNWLGLLPSLFAAFLNFFKLIGVAVVADTIKRVFLKRVDKIRILKFILNLVVRFPIQIYAIYLSWYIFAMLSVYRLTDNVLLANVALQTTIAMFIGIVFGIISFIRNK